MGLEVSFEGLPIKFYCRGRVRCVARAMYNMYTAADLHKEPRPYRNTPITYRICTHTHTTRPKTVYIH